MGAQAFRMTVLALLYPQAQAAEQNAWDRAGGFDVPYTGTMASKSGVTVWPTVPFDFARTGLTREVAMFLERVGYNDDGSGTWTRRQP